MQRLPARTKRALRWLAERSRLGALVDRAPHSGSTRGDRDDEHLRLLLAFTLSPGAHCIDVGAHQGDLLRHMMELAPAGRHLAYEPLPELAAELETRFPDAEIRNAALGDIAGESTFVHVTNHPAYSGFRRRALPADATTREIRVIVERLDDSLPEGFQPDFVKVDVEGAEFQVFQGARETLERFKPMVWFEHGIGAADRYGTRPADVYELLVRDVGLRIFDADGGGPYSRSGFEETFARGGIFNFLARA
jgi:FkbM family methyltransferase